MSKKIILASYLVWYCNEGFIQDDDNDIQQAHELVVMPSIDVTADTMKELYRVEMNKKYGEGKWKLEYFIFIKECDTVEKEPDDPFPLNNITNEDKYSKRMATFHPDAEAGGYVVFLSTVGKIGFASECLNYHIGSKVLSRHEDYDSAAEFAKQWEKDNAK